MTLLGVLQSSTEYFKKRKIDNARLNAEHLLAHVLGRKRIELYLEFERALDESELAPLRDLVRRRGQGEPLQHLLGTVEFCGNVFEIDQRAMVPRPETEELVELLKAEGGRRKAETILDVGTGSGVIALSLAAKFPDAQVRAIDISEDALALAAENAERLGLTARVQFRKGNLLEGISETFDLIAANLPYISMQDRQSLAREVLHDPEVALFGGERGDEIIRELIAQAPARLQPNGLLALEIGIGQAEPLIELLAQKNFHDIETKQDYQSLPRFLFARYG
jgi:release factor glutamine methyltransferase